MKIKFKQSPYYGILKKEGNLFIVSTKENPTTHDNIIAKTQAIKNGIDVNEDGSINLKVSFNIEPFIFTNEELKPTCANYERDNLSLLEEFENKYFVGIDPFKDKCEDLIVESVRQKLLDRSNVGVKKYNSTIFDNIDENYIKHLQDELLDGANYCEQVLRLGEFTKNIIEILQSDQNEMSVGNKIIKEYNKLKETK
jgi:hypothetical protein